MPPVVVIDLESDDDDSSGELVGPHNDAQAHGPARNTVIRYAIEYPGRPPPGAASAAAPARASATIDLTGDDEADGGVAGRPGSAVISDDENDSAAAEHDDDDLLIDEAKSTPATASRFTHSSGHSREHVRQKAPPVPAVELGPDRLTHLSSLQLQLAETVKVKWGLYPWEVTSAPPPQIDANLVCDIHELACAGCSLETAKDLIEDSLLILNSSDPKPELDPTHTTHSEDAASGRPRTPEPAPEQENLATLAGTPPLESCAQPEKGEVKDRINNESISNLSQPHDQSLVAQDSDLAEAILSVRDNPPEDTLTKAEPAENTDIAQAAQSGTGAVKGMDSTEPSDSQSDTPYIVASGENAKPKIARDYMDRNGNISMFNMKAIMSQRSREMHEDREYFTKFRLGRARRIHRCSEPATTGQSANDFISGPSIVPVEFAQDSFPWKDAPTIQTRGTVKPGDVKPGDAKPMNQKSQEVFSHGNKGIRSIISNPVDFYAVDTVPVPPYTNYVSLKQSVLAENHRTLLVYPYFDDNQDEDVAKKSLWDELQSRYNIVADELRLRRLLQAEQSWQLRSYADKILDDIGCAPEVILRYFLMPPDELKRNFEEVLKPKHVEYLENARRESTREEYDREKKRWRMVLENLPPSKPSEIAFAATACRAWAEVFQLSFWHIARRSVLAQPMNLISRPRVEDSDGYSDFAYRDLACRVCHLHNCPFHGAILEQPEPTYLSESEESDAAHESSDSAAKIPGLRRSSVSSETSGINFKKHVLDPINRYNDALYNGKCGNVNIQRNVPRRTLLGQSEVQGFGLYAGEKLSAGDFVGEYKGEVVTKEEGSRRGAVYQHLKTNYLFDLNRAQEVDSTRAGNKLRFINNSAKAPNCEPRVMLCNTVVRIGLFANKDLEPGDEMFFNYNYPEEVTKHFWEKGQAKPSGSAYAVKTKKGAKGKGKAANSSRSSDSEFPAAIKSAQSNGRAIKGKKPGPSRRADEGRSRLGETPLRGSSTISRYACATKGKRPRHSALERQRTWQDLNDVLGEEDDESFGDSEQDFDSEENGRARKRARKARV
ncbi:hypothetical protein SLS58_006007 [Diplodia intermedia]|uniref:SET domain-containing protein n=1 Tax=Diplodia intermedia TaxID=856260 RepID=A0ABR3TP67_9PEZI